jgi:hypothetical protein
VYHIKAVDKGKVGYQCGTGDVVANITYSLFLLLVYTEVVLILGVQLIICGKLVLVQV